MGTRCLTVIKVSDKSSPDLCVIYRQMDGYPSGHGEDVKRLIGNIVVTNGYGDDTTVANGMGCLAAQLVTGLKLDVLKHHEKMSEWRKDRFPGKIGFLNYRTTKPGWQVAYTYMLLAQDTGISYMMVC